MGEGGSFIERAVARLRRAWQELAEGDTAARLPQLPRPESVGDPLDRLRDQIVACMDGIGGEVTARARAADLGRTYLGFDKDGRARFLTLLAEEFGPDPAKIDEAVARLSAAGDPAARRNAERALRQALEPPCAKLFARFTALEQGVKFLVDLRGELMRLARERKSPALFALDADLRDLLARWFDVGLLELRRITWNAPASLLEKLAAYEAVHAIQSWQDMKNRLDSDRRCFAFFHPNMPDEPLIFVEVALVDGLAGNIHALLDESAPLADPRRANTAIFYSISNAQAGLAGISFGAFLIKRVVELLQAEFRELRTFATLSPIPGFMSWLKKVPELGLSESELAVLRALPKPLADSAAVRAALAADDWASDPATAEALRRPLMRLCAHYLMVARRNGGGALDPVAHFHLSNGARMERLNWLADQSSKGLKESAGMMINYQYRLADIESQHEAYTAQGTVAASPEMRAFLPT
jgi:malonyl-CoA decarboxylase